MKLLIEPYEYQKQGIQFAKERRYSLNGDSMGLGKTLQGLGLACEIDAKRTLIICPAFLIPNWKEEIFKFTGELADTTGRLCNPQFKFDVVSYQSLQKVDRCFSQYDLVICDEIHYAKNIKAQRTKYLHHYIEQYEPSYFLGLSGTPIKNRVPEFWSLLRLVWLGGKYPHFDKYSGSMWSFNRDFTKEVTLNFGGRKVTKWEGLKNPEKLKALIEPIYIRRRSDEVLDLPDEIHSEILMAETSRTDGLLKKAWEAYEGKKQSKSYSSGKAISALAKAEYTVEFVKDLLAQEEGVVIFTDHLQAAKKLHSELSKEHEAGLVTGGIPVPERHRLVTAMNTGELKILVATIGSLSVGVNLTGVSTMVFNDFAWVPADMDQARKRIHRIGQTNRCRYYYIMASKFDQAIYTTLKKKAALLAEVNT